MKIKNRPYLIFGFATLKYLSVIEKEKLLKYKKKFWRGGCHQNSDLGAGQGQKKCFWIGKNEKMSTILPEVVARLGTFICSSGF